MIQVTNLSVAYDAQSTAIENVSLTIAEPMIMGIIGPNGAGKSILLKATLALLPSKGTVVIAGEEAKKGGSMWHMWSKKAKSMRPSRLL